MDSEQAAMAPAAEIRAGFTGNGSDFFDIVWRGSLLQIPTFGFYRFWLITQARRYLWSHTRLGEDSLEYTGKAKQILLGFLIAVGILIPVYLGYFLLGLEAEQMQAYASMPLALVFYALYQYANYRARRYRLTHTSFRGLRFTMGGSGWAYAANAFAWDILVGLTFGLALPWRAAALERYCMENTRFGDLQCRFDATGGQLFKRAWGLWLLCVGGVLLVFGLSTALFLSAMPQASGKPQMPGAMALMPALTFALFAFIGLIVWPLFKALQLRWRVGGWRIGDVAFASDLRKGPIVGAYVKGALAILGMTILFVMAVVGYSWALGPSMVEFNVGKIPVAFFAGFAVIYLLFLVCCNMALTRFVTYNVWATVAASTTLIGVGALEAAAASSAPADQMGDGIADAFDFGGIGI